MANSRRRTLHPAQANYLRSEIEGGTLSRKKLALQQICKLFRNGFIISNSDRTTIEIAILGVLSSASSDEKVRRWGVAALAHVGRRDVSQKAVIQILSGFPEEPQVLAAAIATLFKFDSGHAQSLVTGLNILSPEMIALSALQTTNETEIELSGVRIDIEKSDAFLLKQSLLLVGLNRAPDHIFDPKHSNGEVVKILGKHDDPLVAQYSVWAVAENQHLGVKNIGMKVSQVDELPPNVRTYVYRLYAEDEEVSSCRHDIICQGSKDRDDDARLGLSIGLRDSYYDGLEEVTLDWFHDEENEEVQAHILDHLISQSGRLDSYKNVAVEQYRYSANDLNKRARMSASAANTELFAEFRRISIEEEAGLFGMSKGNQNVTNNNFTNNGTILGALSQSGEAVNEGSIQAVLTQHQISGARDVLVEIDKQVETLPLSENLKQEIKNSISAANTATNKSTLGKVVQVLESTKNGLSAVAGMADNAQKIGGFILALGSYLS